MIAPKAFKSKDKDPETLLIDFDLYVKTIKNFFIAPGKDGVTNKQKVALLQAVGGPDMVDIVEELGKVVLEDVAADDTNHLEAVVQTPSSKQSRRSGKARPTKLCPD